MRGATSGRLAGALAVCSTVLMAANKSDALAFSSAVSSRLHSRSISRALTPRTDRTVLCSTAAPERVATRRTTTNNAKIATATTQEEESIPSNMPEALNRFFLGRDKGPIYIVGMLAFLTTWRLSLASVTFLDAAMFGGMILFWCVQEHFIHDKLLHSEYNWMGKEIHESHHQKPYFNISIDPAWLMVAWLATAHALMRVILPLPLALSATLGYASAGLVYEWAHYIVHTRVKPPNAFWKRVRDNHVRHHLVDDRYWLSFTLPMVDDLFGTNPSLAQVKREQAMDRRSSGGRRQRTTRSDYLDK